MDARNRRREEDIKKLKKLAEEHPGVINILDISGNPISCIRLRIRLRTAANSDYPQQVQEFTDIRIDLSSDYPRIEPKATVLTKVWNPNIYASGQICMGSKWMVTEFLDQYVYRIMQILVYDPLIINADNPANTEARNWYKDMKRRSARFFPTVMLSELKRVASRPIISWRNLGTSDAKSIINCPKCNTSLRVVTGHRLKVTCPNCNYIFEIKT